MRFSEERDGSLGAAVANAAWWSTLTQFASKLISPVTTIVMARLLTPEAFGLVALSTMVTSLANMFSDAGFQRYLVQSQFSDLDEESNYASVAFWANMVVSAFIVMLVFLCRKRLAAFLGCSGYGSMLFVSSLSIPVTALSGVQTALYQKHLDFRPLFGSRVGSSFLIFLVAVPMALTGFSYWSLVLSTLSSELFLAVWLTALSGWKPSLFFDFKMLGQMLSYGMWILFESFATWLNTWLGTFIISHLLSKIYIGYYNTSVNMASSITGVVTAAILPVAFSTFARVKHDKDRFDHVLFLMQEYLAMCIIPVAAGCLVYHRMVTNILLGGQWLDASLFFGCWMFMGCTVIVFGNLCSEAYRALGMPRWCVVVQVVYLLPFVPTLYAGAFLGFGAFSVIVPLGRLTLCLIHLCVAKVALGLSPIRMILNPKWTYLQTVLAMLPGILVTSLTSTFWAHVIAAAASMIIYGALVYFTAKTRESAGYIIRRLIKNRN